MKHRPIKQLGQNFLINDEIAKRIVGELHVGDDDLVVEVGPGYGALTRFLVNGCKNLYLIEKDKSLAVKLARRYPSFSNKIIGCDVLDINYSTFWNGKNINFITNLPYNITGPFIFKLIHHRDVVKQVICMLQKEVAERLVAKPGCKQYGIPSVLLQAYYDSEILFDVDSINFYPKPNVISTVIRITRNNVDKLDCDEHVFDNVVHLSFNQRRKTIKNSLNPYLKNIDSDDLHEIRNLLTLRPEQLKISDFIDLTRLVRIS